MGCGASSQAPISPQDSRRPSHVPSSSSSNSTNNKVENFSPNTIVVDPTIPGVIKTTTADGSSSVINNNIGHNSTTGPFPQPSLVPKASWSELSQHASTDAASLLTHDEFLGAEVDWNAVGKVVNGSHHPIGESESLSRSASFYSRETVVLNTFLRQFGEETRNALITKMVKKPFDEGVEIVKQGDLGETMYFIVSGEVIVTKSIGGVSHVVTHLVAGQHFGELALIYNTRRVATVTAKTKTECLVLLGTDLNLFPEVRFYLLLRQMPFLGRLSPEDRLAVCSQLTPKEFTNDELIIQQGTKGEMFFVITSGTALVTEKMEGSDCERVLTKLFEGAFFGEMSLLSNSLRSSSVRAEGVVQCMVLTADVFQKLVKETGFGDIVRERFEKTVATRKTRNSLLDQQNDEDTIQRQDSGQLRLQRSLQLSPSMKPKNSSPSGHPDIPTHISLLRSYSSQNGSPISPKNPSNMNEEDYLMDTIESQSVQKEKTEKGQNVVNGYTVLDVLGFGSYGKVLLVEKNSSKNKYAMKVVRRERKKKGIAKLIPDNESHDLKNEVAIMKRLIHPNIVRLVEVIDDPSSEKMYLIQEYCEKGPIVQGLERCEPLPADCARRYLRDVLRGIEYLHLEGVVHRDIKPANLLRTGDDTVKIADFGVARTIADGTMNAVPKGTPAFMAPELLALQGPAPLDPSVDVWSLGATLYMMVEGKPPWIAPTWPELARMVVQQELVFSPASMSRLDPSLRNLISRMLCKDRTKRASLYDVMAHDWVTNEGTEPMPPVSMEVFLSVKQMRLATLGRSSTITPTQIARSAIHLEARQAMMNELMQSGGGGAPSAHAGVAGTAAAFSGGAGGIMTTNNFASVNSRDKNAAAAAAANLNGTREGDDYIRPSPPPPLSLDKIRNKKPNFGSGGGDGTASSTPISSSDNNNNTSSSTLPVGQATSVSGEESMPTVRVSGDGASVSGGYKSGSESERRPEDTGGLGVVPPHLPGEAGGNNNEGAPNLHVKVSTSEAPPKVKTLAKVAKMMDTKDEDDDESVVVMSGNEEDLFDIGQTSPSPMAAQSGGSFPGNGSGSGWGNLSLGGGNGSGLMPAPVSPVAAMGAAATDLFGGGGGGTSVNGSNASLAGFSSPQLHSLSSNSPFLGKPPLPAPSLSSSTSSMAPYLANLNSGGSMNFPGLGPSVEIHGKSNPFQVHIPDHPNSPPTTTTTSSRSRTATPHLLVNGDQMSFNADDSLQPLAENTPHPVLLVANTADGGEVLDLHLRYGEGSRQGPRPSNEDRVLCVQDLASELLLTRGRDEKMKKTYAIFGIFDGHGGSTSADKLQTEFPLCIAKAMDSIGEDKLETVIKTASEELDTKLLEQDEIRERELRHATGLIRTKGGSHSFYEHSSGSTASIMIFCKQESKPESEDNPPSSSSSSSIINYYLAWCGDSRVVLCRGGIAIDLSEDHHVTLPREIERIKERGGEIINGRLFGDLRVSRCFGDRRHKITGALTCDMECIAGQIEENDEFVILASDGIWDVLSSQSAVNFVRRALRVVRDSQAAANALLDKALELGTMDNHSCVVVAFHQKKWDDEGGNVRRNPSMLVMEDDKSASMGGGGESVSISQQE